MDKEEKIKTELDKLIDKCHKETSISEEEIIKHILTFHIPLKKMDNPLKKFRRR